MSSLAVKYRPVRFEDVCSQKSVIKILKRQLELKQFSNLYMFTGSTGTGKTTLARIFAQEINDHQGSPIEIDGASNNGVDNIRAIVDSAKERSLDSKYKIFIIDECHMITTAGWNAFLKCIEEVPTYTIIIFCTTNPEKVPPTILNRVMRFNLSRIDLTEIKQRLKYIANQERLDITDESIDYIAKLSQGGMRDAIAYLEKCMSFDVNLDISKVLECLGDFSYDSFFEITNAFIDGKQNIIFNIIEKYYNSGKDLSKFIDQYLSFVLDILEYCIFKNLDCIQIPISYEEKLRFTTSIEGNTKYFNALCDKILAIKNTIKYDLNAKTTIEVMCLDICRGL